MKELFLAICMFIAPRRTSKYLLWQVRRRRQLAKEQINEMLNVAAECKGYALKWPNDAQPFLSLADKLLLLASTLDARQEEMKAVELRLELQIGIYA